MWFLENKNCIRGSCCVCIGQRWSGNSGPGSGEGAERRERGGVGPAELRSLGTVCLQRSGRSDRKGLPGGPGREGDATTKVGKVGESRLGRAGQAQLGTR